MTTLYQKLRHRLLLPCGCLTACLLTTQPALAQDLPRDWTSLRHAGTGFATVTTSNDSESAFANPAGLARMRNPRSRNSVHEIHFPRITVEASEAKAQSMGDQLLTSPNQFATTVLSQISEDSGSFEQHSAINAFPSIVFGGKSKPTFLVGIYGSSALTVRHESNQLASTFNLTQETTVGAALGFAGVSRAGTISYGVSIRPNLRYFKHTEDFDINNEDKSSLQFGDLKLDRTVSVGVDAGILFTAADFWLPTFGLAVRNIPWGCADQIANPYTGAPERICGSKRNGAASEGQARTLLDPAEVRAGLSITPRFRIGKDKLNLRISGEASPIAIPSGDTSYGFQNVPLEQMLKAGLEIFFGHPLMLSGFALRGGIYNAEPTWGLTASLFFVQVEYASYVRQYMYESENRGKNRQHLFGISTTW